MVQVRTNAQFKSSLFHLPVEPELATDAPEFRYWKRSLVDRITIYALMPCAFFLITIRWTVDPEFRSLAIPITFVHVVCVMSAAYLLRGVVTMFLEAVFAMSDDGRSLEQLLRFIPDDQRVIAMANFFRRFGASDQKLKETDRSLIVQGFQTNYMQVARAIAVASVGLMPHDRHVVMRMQELLDKASDDAEFDGFRALGQILGVDIKRRWMLPILGPMLQRRDGFTPDWTTLTEDQKKAIYCACAVSDRAHEAVVQLFDFADIPIEEEKAIVVAGLSDIPTGARNWPNRMVAYGILMTMTSKDRLWSLMAKVVGGNVYSASWVAMPSPIAHPEFELDRTQDRITIGGRMFLLSMLVSLTVLWAITPGRQVIVSNRVLQEFFQVTSYNAGFLTESLEHVLILSYVMAASILVITPITMFIFLVREVGLVKVSVEDRDIDPFGTIMNRKMITKLTTIGALAIITGLQAYFTVTADPSLLALLTDLSGLLQVVTAVSFPIAYACYANSPMIPHVVRAFDEGLYRRITPEGGALEKYELAVDERTMSVSMKVMDDDDDAISFSRVAPAPFTPMASAPPEPQPTLPIEPAPAPSAPFVPVPAPTPAMAPMMQPIASTPPPAAPPAPPAMPAPIPPPPAPPAPLTPAPPARCPLRSHPCLHRQCHKRHLHHSHHPRRCPLRSHRHLRHQRHQRHQRHLHHPLRCPLRSHHHQRHQCHKLHQRHLLRCPHRSHRHPLGTRGTNHSNHHPHRCSQRSRPTLRSRRPHLHRRRPCKVTHNPVMHHQHRFRPSPPASCFGAHRAESGTLKEPCEGHAGVNRRAWRRFGISLSGDPVAMLRPHSRSAVYSSSVVNRPSHTRS